ncbi:hypothetical protein RBB78_11170 [Tunturiibacter empetritectus]|uniref:hypothetical protein n=1 Tax=Tunturiibacter empetritectus TaxID=3069691 RepID=UPI003D9BAF43
MNPQIGFDLLKGIQESENRDVSLCEIAVSFMLLAKSEYSTAQQACAYGRYAGRRNSRSQELAPIRRFLNQSFRLCHFNSPFVELY